MPLKKEKGVKNLRCLKQEKLGSLALLHSGSDSAKKKSMD